MKKKVLASTKIGYELPIEQAIEFSGLESRQFWRVTFTLGSTNVLIVLILLHVGSELSSLTPGL